MPRHFATALLVAFVCACGAPQGEPADREAGARPRRAEAIASPPPARVAEARVVDRPVRAFAERAAVRALPPASPDHTTRAALSGTRPGNLDDAFQDMGPAEFVRAIEEIQGPLEGAHYLLQRESEVEIVGERPAPAAGELSIVDCALRDPEDPTRGRSFWIGGLRLDGGPDLFEGRIERRRVLTVFGRGIHYSGRWPDAAELRGRLTGFGRTLDAAVDEAGPEEIRIWRRDLVQDADEASTASFRAESDACPFELTLRLRVEEGTEHWQLVERDGELHPYRVALDPGETIARATLVARWVSPDPEIIDPAQRTLRAKRFTPVSPLPRLEVALPPPETPLVPQRIRPREGGITRRQLDPQRIQPREGGITRRELDPR